MKGRRFCLSFILPPSAFILVLYPAGRGACYHSAQVGLLPAAPTCRGQVKASEMKTDLRPRTGEHTAVTGKTLQPARPAPPSDAPETAPIHQTITPEQAALASQAPRPARRPPPTPSEFNTAMAHFYRGEIT